MTTDIQKTALRLPRELHSRILEAAENSGRSMNAEITSRLQDSFSSLSPPQYGAYHSITGIDHLAWQHGHELTEAMRELYESLVGPVSEASDPSVFFIGSMGEAGTLQLSPALTSDTEMKGFDRLTKGQAKAQALNDKIDPRKVQELIDLLQNELESREEPSN